MGIRARRGVGCNDFESQMVDQAKRFTSTPHARRPAPTELKGIHRSPSEVGQSVSLRTPAPPDAGQGSLLAWFRS